MLNSLLLSILLISSPASADDYDKAGRYLAKAIWKEYRVDKALKVLEEKYIPEDVREVGGNLFLVGRILYEKKVVFKWSF